MTGIANSLTRTGRAARLNRCNLDSGPFQNAGPKRPPTERWRVQSTHQHGTCRVSAGRDGVGDGQSRWHFNFQVHVRGTIVSATGVIQNAQETFRGLFRARKGAFRTFLKVEKFLAQSGEIYISYDLELGRIVG